MDTSLLWRWVNERHATYLRKAVKEGAEPSLLSKWSNEYLDRPAGDALRWGAKGYKNETTGANDAFTRDPIMQQYRFCNVFRELDRVTAWIRYNIRRRYADHPDLWLMLAIARYINWPETLQELIDAKNGCWPGDADFNPTALGYTLDCLKDVKGKLYTGAYMIRAESNPKAEWYSWTKQQYIARIVIGRLWEDRESWRGIGAPCPTCINGAPEPYGCSDCLNTGYAQGPSSMEQVWERFQQPRYIGWGPFMAYQVVVDMRHTRLLSDAPDINTWAALGPGSRRGLNRLAGRPVDYALSQEQGLDEMMFIWGEQDNYRAPWVPRIELSDIQNALCETDKYIRALSGEGRPRARYVPGRGW